MWGVGFPRLNLNCLPNWVLRTDPNNSLRLHEKHVRSTKLGLPNWMLRIGMIQRLRLSSQLIVEDWKPFIVLSSQQSMSRFKPNQNTFVFPALLLRFDLMFDLSSQQESWGCSGFLTLVAWLAHHFCLETKVLVKTSKTFNRKYIYYDRTRVMSDTCTQNKHKDG